MRLKKSVSLFLSLHGVDWTPTGRKEGGVGARERDRAARVDREMAYLQKEKCGVKAVLFSLHSLDCSVVRKVAFSILFCTTLYFSFSVCLSSL